MRFSIALFVALCPSLASAQITGEQKKATVAWLQSLQDPQGGFYADVKDPKTKIDPMPGLRATNGAVRALKYLGAEVPDREKNVAFVLKCYDPKTGGFADTPGGKPDVTTTSVGVMAAAEFDIPHEKYAKAMDYLKENAKTFEEVRIAAAAVEAWGVKECPFKLDEWFRIAEAYGRTADSLTARGTDSLAAMYLRLGRPLADPPGAKRILTEGQFNDGGYGRVGDKSSDIETTYRVMRALMLLKDKPKDVKKLREFVAAHRNADGGYATAPGRKSSAAGTYFAVIISKWLDEMEKK